MTIESTTKTVTALVVEPGVVVANRFEICERLGAGGVGMVYRAIDRELDGEVVALKLLLPHLAQDETVFRRFRNEVLVARTLSHPNIVRTHDMGRAESGYSYISMEYVSGESLKDKLVQRAAKGEIRPSLAFDEALAVLYHIMSGVAYAHGRGVIHRDLKPANVLISTANEVKLADFGTARMLGMDTTLTQTGQIIGTPDYMSPEQIRGELLDPSCDIYALGVMAYELVTGDRPFTADSAVAVAFKHLNDPLPPFPPDKNIPLWFQEVAQKATAKEKANRFSSMMEFAATLLDYAPHLSVQSTFFSVDRTVRVGALGTGSAKAVAEEAAAPAAGPGSGGNGGGSAESLAAGKIPRTGETDLRFELGAQPEAAGELTGEWKLGSLDDVRPLVDENRTMRRRRERDRPDRGSPLSGIAFGVIGGLLVLYLGLLTAASFNVGLRQRIQRRLILWHDASPALVGLIGSALRIDLPKLDGPANPSPGAGVTTSGTSDTGASQAGGGGLTVVPAATVTPAVIAPAPTQPVAVPTQPVAVPTALPAAAATAAPAVAPTAVPTAAPTAVPTAVPTAAPTAAPTAVPTAAPLKVAGTISFADTAHHPVDDSVSVDRLSQIQWTVALQIESGTPDDAAVRKLRDTLAVRVMDVRKNALVVKLKPDQFVPPKGDASPKVSGSFHGLKQLNPGAGSYRIEVVSDEELLAKKDFVLYRTSAGSSGRSEPTGNGSGPIRIVTDSTAFVQPPADNGEVAAATPPPATPQPAPTAPAVVSGNGNPGTLNPGSRNPSNYGNAVGGNGANGNGNADGVNIIAPVDNDPASVNGLPVAAGHSGREGRRVPQPTEPGGVVNGTGPNGVGPNGMPVDPARLPDDRGFNGTAPGLNGGAVNGAVNGGEPPAEVQSLSEAYSGSLHVPRDGGGEDRVGVTLDLEIRGEQITGRANITGYDEFSVTGSIHTRGIVLELRNSQQWVRLSSGPRGTALRGIFSFPGIQKKGSWDATRTRG